MKNKKILLIAGSVLMLVGIFVMGMKIYKKSETKRLGFLTKENSDAFVRDYSPRLGSPDAPVYVVEFLDPECESCREFYPHTKRLLKQYEGKIQLVVRYAPFHGNSKFAIKILEAAKKQNKYWETLEVLFKYQPEWGSHHHPQPELIWNRIGEAGVDVDQIRKDLDDPATDKMIEQEILDGQKLQVRGTPSFFVNGKAVESFSYEGLESAVVEAMNQL